MAKEKSYSGDMAHPVCEEQQLSEPLPDPSSTPLVIVDETGLTPQAEKMGDKAGPSTF